MRAADCTILSHVLLCIQKSAKFLIYICSRPREAANIYVSLYSGLLYYVTVASPGTRIVQEPDMEGLHIG